MAKLILNGATSGSVTLESPAVSGTTTLTLPATSGTVLTTTSPKAGNVIQVVQATYSTQVNISSVTFLDTGLTATITPTSATSKILVLISQPLRVVCNANFAEAGSGIKIVRNSTDVYTLDNSGRGILSQEITSSVVARQLNVVGSLQYLDSPASASALTYKTMGNVNSATAATANYQINSLSATIILMEIAA